MSLRLTIYLLVAFATLPAKSQDRSTSLNVPAQGKSLPASGNFHITFANGVEFASGRTVYGTFEAKFP